MIDINMRNFYFTPDYYSNLTFYASHKEIKS